ncbi:MAG: DNA methyltransferase [Nocardioidaceae bacterium]
MKPFILQSLSELAAQRPPHGQEIVHFTESLAEAVIEEYSDPGDLVLDPFAGFGTTLVVAERLGRRALGVELLPERVDQIRERLAIPESIVSGDARKLDQLLTEQVALCLTSPPYMTVNDHPENPLEAYQTDTGDYPTYLREIGEVFGHVARSLRPGGYAVINVANIVSDQVLTPLAWDVARIVAKHLTLRQESFLCWDRQPSGISGDYCMVFQQDDG